MAYGPNLLGLYRRVGVLAGKVLRGANPADLPIERPTKFELVLNLRAATALGLSYKGAAVAYLLRGRLRSVGAFVALLIPITIGYYAVFGLPPTHLGILVAGRSTETAKVDRSKEQDDKASGKERSSEKISIGDHVPPGGYTPPCVRRGTAS
jgi:hypothetical protein